MQMGDLVDRHAVKMFEHQSEAAVVRLSVAEHKSNSFFARWKCIGVYYLLIIC